MLSDTDLVVQLLAAAFESLGIAYMVGGSVASSLFGTPRFTRDVDIAALIPATVEPDALVSLLQRDFYIDADMIRQAAEHHSSFNVIYLPTMIKADIFLPENTPWRQEEWRRRRRQPVGTEEDEKAIFFTSPEDMVLQKLLWYRETGERSDRQWGDVQSMLRIQAKVLTMEYMEHWATELGIADLLERALQEAGLR